MLGVCRDNRTENANNYIVLGYPVRDLKELCRLESLDAA